MHRVTIDQSVRAKLGNLREFLELCDESGHVLGHFSPAEERSLYENVKVPVSDEELDRIERQGGGRSLTEIMADLEKRA